VNIDWKRVREIIRKEFLQLLRHRRMRVVLFVPPMLQLIIFGYAVNLDVENVRTAWMDEDHTPASRELLAAFQGSGRFQVVALPQNSREIQSLLDSGRVQAVIRVLPGFAAHLERGRSTAVQVMVDGSNSNTAWLISSYASEIVGAFESVVGVEQQQRRLMAASPGSISLKAPRVEARSRIWFNPDLKSRNYFVPGVVVNLIMVVTVMLTSMAIVREKEIGTMEQLMVTPIRPIELMVGKTLPFAAVGLMDLLLVTTLALLVFHVPLKGNFFLLLLCACFFLMTSLGVGLFLSTIASTQQQALMSSFFFATPSFMLSGFAFPIRNMPEIVQYLTYLNPLRHFMEIVRGIFLKGVGASVLWPQMLILFVYGIAILSLSAARFRKRID
jgi:ABC-2 type transport system permease protein